jgi:hypothetical protein
MKGFAPQQLKKNKLQLATKLIQPVLEVGDVSAYHSEEGGEKDSERNIASKNKSN